MSQYTLAMSSIVPRFVKNSLSPCLAVGCIQH